MAFSDGNVAERLRGRVVSWRISPARHPSRPRARLHASGRPAGQPAGGDRQPRILAAAPRRRRTRRAARSGSMARTTRSPVCFPRRSARWSSDRSSSSRRSGTPRRARGPSSSRRSDACGGASAAAATGELRTINRRIFPLWRASYQDDKATWSMMELKTHVIGDVGTIAGLALAAVDSCG